VVGTGANLSHPFSYEVKRCGIIPLLSVHICDMVELSVGSSLPFLI